MIDNSPREVQSCISPNHCLCVALDHLPHPQAVGVNDRVALHPIAALVKLDLVLPIIFSYWRTMKLVDLRPGAESEGVSERETNSNGMLRNRTQHVCFLVDANNSFAMFWIQ
jgi:hypothetical protein